MEIYTEMSTIELFNTMAKGDAVAFVAKKGRFYSHICGIVQSIEREDGSGYNYNVKLTEGGFTHMVFVSTHPERHHMQLISTHHRGMEVFPALV